MVVRTRTTTGSFPARQIGAGAGDDVGHQARPADRNYASLSTFYTLESVQLAPSIELANSLKLKLRGGDLFAVLPFFFLLLLPEPLGFLFCEGGWVLKSSRGIHSHK